MANVNEGGDIQKFNASKDIAQQRDVKLILAHMDAIRQARSGETPFKSLYEMKDNEKKMNMVRGLMLVIYAQQDLILMSGAQVRSLSLAKWKKETATEKEREENPFEKHENDYNKLRLLSELLDACKMDIIEADRTRDLKDDFLIKKNTVDGEVFEVTDNYYSLLKELETAYVELEGIMYRNKVISAGMEIDEEKTTRELEQDFINSVVEA